MLCFNSSSQSYPSIVNIYEYGDSLYTCETNLKNLFQNWNNNHINNSYEYSLINYAFVEEISDTSTIKLYSDLVTTDESLLGIVKSNSFSKIIDNKNTKITEQTFSVRRFGSLLYDSSSCTSKERADIITAFEKERENLSAAFRSIVNVGDKVYVIFFKDSRHIYSAYIVCSSQTKRVIWDNVFRNIKAGNI